MNIFICQTPFQLFYTHQIIEYLNNVSIKKDEYLIIHSNLDLSFSDWVLNTKFINTGSGLGSYNRFKKLRTSIKYIIKTTETKPEINFYLPHTSGLLPNFIFHNRKFINDPKIEINFFYEGVLYFYDFQEKFQKFHLNRILTSLLLGFRYKYNRVILPYNSNRISKIYTPCKKFTKGQRDLIFEIPFQINEDNTVNKDHFLILGGPVDYLKEFYITSINEILSIKLFNPIIYYKGHASFKTHNPSFKYIFHEVVRNYNLKYIELDDNIPIELLLQKINPFKIYSYYSSALLNIKFIYPKKYDIVCYLNRTDKVQLSLEKIFKYYNVKVALIK